MSMLYKGKVLFTNSELNVKKTLAYNQFSELLGNYALKPNLLLRGELYVTLCKSK